MARRLRLEYPGAIYHVINRGNYRSSIFETEGAKVGFEKALFEACERAGWILHAYVVMENHFHLALETPEPNLSEGMRWLGSVFALRFNRFRKENGALFQGRYKSIVVEDFERLGWLCHYIHLNPVRAGICAVRDLGQHRWGSMSRLRRPGSRPPFLSFEASLAGAGELADCGRGWTKYEQYLSWLAEDEPGMKAMHFGQMSKGWAFGSRQFKESLLEDEGRTATVIALSGRDAVKMRELAWSATLTKAMKVLGKKRPEIAKGRKSEDWKVAVAGVLKTRQFCRNGWIAEQLNMGTVYAVSRYVSQMLDGKRPEATRLYKTIMTKIKL